MRVINIKNIVICPALLLPIIRLFLVCFMIVVGRRVAILGV